MEPAFFCLSVIVETHGLFLVLQTEDGSDRVMLMIEPGWLFGFSKTVNQDSGNHTYRLLNLYSYVTQPFTYVTHNIT